MIFLSIGLCCLPSACHNTELWSDLPKAVNDFITQYFPNSELQSVSNSGGVCHVRIEDGPGLTFNEKGEWESIDGYGMPLPQVLLFDQLPPKLYGYLQETQQLDSVFSMQRDGVKYTLTLLDSDLYYNSDTGELTGSDARVASA